MSVHFPTKDITQPPLADRLRYIDITFDSAIEAHDRLIASGEIERFVRAPDHERSRKVGKLAMRIVAQKVLEEGLHPGVLTEGARKAYDQILEEEASDRLLQVRVCAGMGAE